MLDPASISMIAALVILVILSAFFSATETAFTSLNRIRLKSRADSGNKRAALTLRIAEDYDKLLSTNLIGNNIVNISASTVGTVLFTKLFLDYGPLVSTVVLPVVILVFGEISPKSMAKENAEEKRIAGARERITAEIARMEEAIRANRDKLAALDGMLEEKKALFEAEKKAALAQLGADMETAREYAGHAIQDVSALQEEVNTPA